MDSRRSIGLFFIVAALTPATTLSLRAQPIPQQGLPPAPATKAPAEEVPLLNRPEVANSERGTVELHVADLPLSTVLRLLSLEGQRNIIASPNVKGTVTANLYNVTFEQALDAVLIPNGAGFRQVGHFIYVYTNKEFEEMAVADADKRTTRIFRLNYITAQDARTYLQPILGEEDVIAVSPPPGRGLESQNTEGGGADNALQDFIVVTATPDRVQQIETMLRELDARPKQVLIEATILRARLDNDNALGIDFTIVGGVDLEGLDSTSDASLDLLPGPLPQDRFELFNSNVTTDFRGNVPDGGITVGVIKDHVALFVRALEEVTDTVVVANPKVLALNKQKGQVIVGQRDGYLTTTVTETQAVQTVEFLETGTSLIFRPFVGSDGRIRVELHPEDSVGFISAQGLPSEQTTEVTTNVIVRDGETILIGGLFREVTTDARSQVPGVGSLPVVGTLFRSKNETSTREEVIILLTIKVVRDDDAYADESREQFENVERLRVGLREGLMWFGREPLAQCHYRKALDALRANDRDQAMWQLRMALHCYPRLIPAIELRDKLVGERAWEEDGTGGRAFLHRLIAREKGYPLEMFGRPAPPPIEPPNNQSTPATAPPQVEPNVGQPSEKS